MAGPIGRVPALDGLRGVAVLVVLVHHLPLVDIFLTGRWTLRGELGVDIFFVLSGFLITGVLLSEEHRAGRVSFGRFYLRRALRLLPALVAFLAVHLVYARWVGIPWPKERGAALSVLFYYSNIASLAPPTVEGLGHLWTLAVEEQFYMLWPIGLVVFAPLRRHVLLVVGAFVVAIGSVILYRHLMWERTWGQPFREGYLQSQTLARVDQLLIGALLAHLAVRRLIPRSQLLGVAAWLSVGWLAYVIKFGVSERFLVQGRTLVGIAVAVVIAAITSTEWRGSALLRFGPLRLAGQVSYGVYLWHVLVLSFVRRYGSAHGWDTTQRIAVGLVLTALATAASWMLVERPALRLKDRIARADVGPVAAEV